MLKLKRITCFDTKSIVYAGFLSAGNLKEDPRLEWLPVDLTVALAGLSLLIAAFIFIRPGFRFPKGLYWAIILFFLFGVPLVWTEWTLYATEKVSRLFTLTLLAALLPVIMFRTEKDQRKLFTSFTVISVFMTFDALSIYLSGSVDRIAYTAYLSGNGVRITSAATNTIAVSRSVGMGALWLALLVESGERNAALLLLIGPMVMVMVGSGSRGPLIAFIMAMCIQSALSSSLIGSSRIRVFFLYGSLSAFFLGSWALAPEASTERIQIILNGEKGTSGESRSDAYSLTLTQIGRHPLGLGWGGFAYLNGNLSDSYKYQSGIPGSVGLATLRYPHNIFFEITLECGWVCGFVFILMLCVSIYRSIYLYRRTKFLEYRALFAMIIFQTVNVAFSGEINDSRIFISFVMIGIESKFHTSYVI